MTLESRIFTLRGKHADLDRVILHEQSRPAPDALAIKKLKLRKLRVKEEIERLEPVAHHAA
jgi:hypothetical protein